MKVSAAAVELIKQARDAVGADTESGELRVKALESDLDRAKFDLAVLNGKFSVLHRDLREMQINS